MTLQSHIQQRIAGGLLMVSASLVLGLASPALAQCNPAELSKFLASVPQSQETFGHAVAIDGDLAVVGGPRNSLNGAIAGAAYVYTRTNGVWAQSATLFPSDPAAGELFGSSVAISFGTVIIGSPGNDNDNGSQSGAAYVFVQSVGGSWSEQAKLLASDGAQVDQFGNAVAIIKDTVVIGAWLDDDLGSFSGSAYIFQRTFGKGGVQWDQETKIVPANLDAGDLFGISVSIDGDFVVIGAREDVGGSGQIQKGAAYVYEHQNGGNWVQRAHLTASDGAVGDEFGERVSISGDTVAVGAPFDDDHGSDSGSVYLFRTNDGGVTWGGETKIVPFDGAAGDFFGFPVALDGDMLVIGATDNDDFGNNSGSAYVYTRAGSAWIERVNILASDGEEGDRFGISVALDDGSAIIGSFLDDDNGTDSGSVYMYDLSCTICLADLNGDGFTDFLDISIFLSGFADFLPISDLNQDGNWDFLDISEFVAGFAAGCP